MSASRNKIVPALLLGLSFVITSSFSHGIHAQDIAPKVDEYMNAAARVHRFSGTVLLAHNGHSIVSRGYGMADFELGVANTPKTPTMTTAALVTTPAVVLIPCDTASSVGMPPS